jgi:hypothetical protein
MTRWMTTLATAGLAELAAHFLSLTWGFMVLLAAFVYVAVHVTAGVATVASKAKSTEQRVNTLVPVVNTAYTTANNANTTANNALPKSGGTISGTLTVTGDHHVSGNLYGVGGVLSVGDTAYMGNGIAGAGGGTLESSAGFHSSGTVQADSQVITGNVDSNGGSTNEYSGGIHSSQVIQADGYVYAGDLQVGSQRIAPGQGIPGFYPAPSSGSGVTIANLCVAVNQIVSGNIAAGTFN